MAQRFQQAAAANPAGAQEEDYESDDEGVQQQQQQQQMGAGGAVGDAHLQVALNEAAAEHAQPNTLLEALHRMIDVQEQTNRLLDKLVTSQVHASHDLNNNKFFVVSQATFKGSLNRLSKSAKSSVFSHIGLEALKPEGFPEGVDDVLLTGIDITYVKSTFPCSVGVSFSNIGGLLPNYRAQTGKKFHYTVDAFQGTTSVVPLMGERAGVNSEFLRLYPGYTPSNIESLGVMVDPRDKEIVNVHKSSPVLEWAHNALQATQPDVASEIMSLSNRDNYVGLRRPLFESSVKDLRTQMNYALPLAKISTMGQIVIERPGQKWTDVDGLMPDLRTAMLTSLRFGVSSQGFTGDHMFDIGAPLALALGASSSKVNGASSASTMKAAAAATSVVPSTSQPMTEALMDTEFMLTMHIMYKFKPLA